MQAFFQAGDSKETKMLLELKSLKFLLFFPMIYITSYPVHRTYNNKFISSSGIPILIQVIKEEKEGQKEFD
jgi:hypothetical protein